MMSSGVALTVLAVPIGAICVLLIRPLRELRPLLASTPHITLVFPGTELTAIKATAVLSMFALRAIVLRLTVLLALGVKQKSSSTPQSLEMPFEFSSRDVLAFSRLTGSDKSTPNPQHNMDVFKDARLLRLLVASLLSPSIILLTAKRGVDVDGLGAVNVRNTFHTPSEKLASALQTALDQPNMLKAKASVDMGKQRKVKRGWEFDVVVELLEGEQVLFRMTFTTLAKAKHRDQTNVETRTERVIEREHRETGKCRITERDVDIWIDLSKDTNPIHTSHLLARLFGLKGRIAHGNLVVAKALAQISQNSESDAEGEFQAKFLRPVLIPATLDLCETSVGGQRRIEMRSKGKPLVSMTYR